MMFLTLLALNAPAHALDLKWWGVGPTIGTLAIPGKYPVALPTVAQGEVDKVKGDVEIGARGVIYPSGNGRVFGLATLGFGTSGWGQQEFTLGWDQALVKDEEFQLLFGAGIGAGHERFKDKANGDYLNTNYFPIRGQLTALLRDRVRAYAVDIYGTYHIVGGQEYCTSTTDASCTSGKDGGSLIAGALYVGVGAEATFFFGDFRSKGGGNGGGGGKKKK